MDISMDLSRRDWLYGVIGLATWADILEAQQHAHQALAVGSPSLAFFDPETAREVAALAARIVPSDDGPGATEAGAVYFIDRALKTFEADKQAIYRAGLNDLEERRKRLFPDSSSIASLKPEQQDQLLRAVETTEFFNLFRLHTVAGFLSDPSYGGNRNKAGWTYIEFEDRMSWAPPFGYYDGEAK
jgi:gluconate 2-dehydrogenase gamma chain